MILLVTSNTFNRIVRRQEGKPDPNEEDEDFVFINKKARRF